MTLVTREGKGSELTWDELDDNFIHCLDRANHTGTQPASTISDFNSAAGGVANAAVAAHVSAADPHTQYTTAAEAAAAAPVQSVNGETGAVVLSATDVGADAAGTATTAVAAHVADTTPHDVITQVDKLGFDIAAAQTAGVGEMVWNAADGTADLGLPGGVTLQVGQEGLIRVLNKTGSTIQNMHVVYITGAQGQRVTAALAQANSVNADKTLAVATQDIANNAEGFATILGMVRQVNTSAWAEGTELWLSAATPGAITNVRPSAPNHQVRVGYVVRSHASEGIIYVTVNIGSDLSHLHDVVITAPADNDVLIYDSATQTWQNGPQTGGSGEVNTASNLGSGAGVFASKVGVDLQFKSLVAGTGVTLTPTGTTITITASGAGGAVDSVNGQTGAVVLDTDDVAEGVSNLYYTNARASAAAPVQSVNGQTGAVDLSGSYTSLSHVGSGGAAHANVVAGGAAGFMTGADKTKLDSIAAGAQVNVPTNLTTTTSSTTLTVNSDTGADATLPAATTSVAGVMTAADKTKLDGIAAGATANANTDSLAEGATNKYFTEDRVRGTVLTGLSLLTGGVISAADSVLSSLGKLQKQISDAVTTIGGKQDTLVSGTNIKTINGQSLLGPGDLVVSGGAASATYATATIASGALTLNLATASVFGVMLDANVTTLTLSGATSGQRSTIEAIFTQAPLGGYAVVKPASVRLPAGVADIASTAPRDITYVRFSSVDGGMSWLMDKRVIFNVPTPISLPTIADENASFNDEGTATTGWTASNATLSQSGSSVRQTKTAGGSNSSMSKTITFTPSNADYILYGKMKAKYASGAAAVLWLLNGSKEVSIWFGSADANSSSLGAVSICGTTGTSTRNVAQVASGLNYETGSVEFALHYDHKFSTLTCWFREADGRWKWRGRVACNWFSATQIQVLTTTASAAGSWVEFDYLTLAKPNIAVLSDSIGEGKTLFSPDPALALTNDESTWMRHAPIYQSLRNNLIVNKGVGGNTSAQMSARVADVTGAGVRVVFLHASSNDEAASVSQATRTSNIQSTVNSITAASAQVVLLNAMYGTSSGVDNQPTPDLRDYMRTWWTTSMPSLTGVFSSIDIMQPLKVADDFMNASLAQSDGIHPNPTGHAQIGAYIAS